METAIEGIVIETEEFKGEIVADIANFYIGPGASNRLQVYSAYLKHYQRATASHSSEDTVYQVDEPLIKSHHHLQQLVTELRRNPSITRHEFEDILQGRNVILQQETQHAIRTVMRVGFMLNATITPVSKSQKLTRCAQWEELEKFSEFVTRSVPRQNESTLIPYEDVRNTSAWNLKHRSGITFKRTDDLTEHLLYDPNTQVLKIFHQMAWLRAQLQLSKDVRGSMGIEESLKRGTLPPQLIVETLESFYRILFPLAKDKSSKNRSLLRILIRIRGFDSQCIVETHPSPWLAEDFQYHYWGERLEIIARLAQNTAAGNRYTAWIERHTTERQAISIAIIGVVFTAVFGFLAVVVSSAQLAIQIVAWQHPVSA